MGLQDFGKPGMQKLNKTKGLSRFWEAWDAETKETTGFLRFEEARDAEIKENRWFSKVLGSMGCRNQDNLSPLQISWGSGVSPAAQFVWGVWPDPRKKL